MNTRIVVLSVFATMFAGHAFAVDYPNQMTGIGKIACDFEADIVFQRNLDTLDKYVLPNFIRHASPATLYTAEAFRQRMANLPKFNGPKEGCGGAKVVVYDGNYVMFLREGTAPDPNDATKRIFHTHFNVWRFEGNKIAEHWDN